VKKGVFRNTQSFQGHYIVATHVTHGGNFQPCVVAGIKDLHQETNKHLTFRAAAYQVVKVVDLCVVPASCLGLSFTDLVAAVML
jgi:hypothetical protein